MFSETILAVFLGFAAAFVYPAIPPIANPAETSLMVAVPTVFALDCKFSLVVINTLAATAAISTIAIKTIRVSIPTIASMSSFSFLFSEVSDEFFCHPWFYCNNSVYS